MLEYKNGPLCLGAISISKSILEIISFRFLLLALKEVYL